MKKGAKKEIKVRKNETSHLKMVLVGSLLFFSISIITSAVILYSAYFFKEAFVKLAFKIIILLIGILTYYLLIVGFIKLYGRSEE